MSLAKAKQIFCLTTVEKSDIFAVFPELAAINLLIETLNKIDCFHKSSFENRNYQDLPYSLKFG
jgi:hypothetical protein